ncbi:hypothetical protein KAS79_00575 [Candidatus Parcubacteria bacterium]|nr:hypothetical protein [Candidatus Parcubacteria bacterium]
MEKPKEKFNQEDYFVRPLYCDKVLEILKKELEKIEKSGKKSLWAFSAEKTLKHLEKEKGLNLSPHDVENIICALLKYIDNQ